MIIHRKVVPEQQFNKVVAKQHSSSSVSGDFGSTDYHFKWSIMQSPLGVWQKIRGGFTYESKTYKSFQSLLVYGRQCLDDWKSFSNCKS